MATTSKRANGNPDRAKRGQNAVLTVLLIGFLSCAAPSPPAVPVASPVASLALPSPAPLTPSLEPAELAPAVEPARFAFQGAALERLDGSGKTVWRTELSAEKHRQLAVLGSTVLVWGSSHKLQRFDAESGAAQGAATPHPEVSLFVVHRDVLVQSTSDGLIGTGETTTLWRRPDLVSDSLVVGASEQQPVVLLVARAGGRAVALNLHDGREADYPLPPGVFERVTLEPDSGVIGWQPKDGGPTIYCQAEDGTPLDDTP